MRPFQRAALALVLLITVSVVGTTRPAAAAPEPVDKQATERATERAEKAATYCPRAALLFGKIVIPAGRCYVLYLIRDARGLFLVFAAPGAKIPPGQLVRLNTPAGAKLKGRIFYWVPVQGGGFNPPANTVLITPVRVQELGPRLVITLNPGGSAISVTFVVR